MKFIKLAIPLLSALVCTHGQATAGVVLGSELNNFSIFSGTYVSTGDGAKAYGNVLASTYGTTGANSTIFGNFQSGDVGTAGAYAKVFGNFRIERNAMMQQLLKTPDGKTVGVHIIVI